MLPRKAVTADSQGNVYTGAPGSTLACAPYHIVYVCGRPFVSTNGWWDVPSEESKQPGESFDYEKGGSLQEKVLRGGLAVSKRNDDTRCVKKAHQSEQVNAHQRGKIKSLD
jgi:hypothetical protein